MKEAWNTEDWNAAKTLLPDNWEKNAWTFGAMTRTHNITNPEQLLRYLLLYMSAGLSLALCSWSERRWSEFIEFRDALLACPSLPLGVAYLPQNKGKLRGKYSDPPRKRHAASYHWKYIVS